MGVLVFARIQRIYKRIANILDIKFLILFDIKIYS